MAPKTFRFKLMGLLLLCLAATPGRGAAADTLVFAALKYGFPPAVVKYKFTSGGVIRLPGISDATHPQRLAVGSDGKIYAIEMLDRINSAIVVFAPSANGNVAPIAAIAGPRTGLHGTAGIAVDACGTIYATNLGDKSITIFAPGSSGDTPPVAAIAGSDTGFDRLSGIAVDAKGRIYVANGLYVKNARGVLIFAAGSNGNVKPVAAITDATGYADDVAVDSHGRIYVSAMNRLNIYSADASGPAAPIASFSGPPGTGFFGFVVDSSGRIYQNNAVSPMLSLRSEVLVYAADSSGAGVKPIATIAGPQHAKIDYPASLAVGADGKIYVATDEQIRVFAPGIDGDAAPVAVITSKVTGIVDPSGIAIGADGKTYVANKRVTPSSCGGVLVYAPEAYGDVAPLETISGPHTGLQNPLAISVDSAGNVYVLNQQGINQCGKGHSTVADIDPATHFAPITIYSAAAVARGGDVAPTATIGGPHTNLNFPFTMAVDSDGKVYAAAWSPSRILIYPPHANGDVAPMATIAGGQTRLDSPIALAFDPRGRSTWRIAVEALGPASASILPRAAAT